MTFDVLLVFTGKKFGKQLY